MLYKKSRRPMSQNCDKSNGRCNCLFRYISHRFLRRSSSSPRTEEKSMFIITSASAVSHKLSYCLLFLPADYLLVGGEATDSQKAASSSMLPEDFLKLNATAAGQKVNNITPFCHPILIGMVPKSARQHCALQLQLNT